MALIQQGFNYWTWTFKDCKQINQSLTQFHSLSSIKSPLQKENQWISCCRVKIKIRDRKKGVKTKTLSELAGSHSLIELGWTPAPEPSKLLVERLRSVTHLWMKSKHSINSLWISRLTVELLTYLLLTLWRNSLWMRVEWTGSQDERKQEKAFSYLTSYIHSKERKDEINQQEWAGPGSQERREEPRLKILSPVPISYYYSL